MDAVAKVPGVPRVMALCLSPPSVVMTRHGSITLYDMFFMTPQSDGVILEVLREAANTLHELHEAGFAHNDIKNDHISIDYDSATGQVEVTLLDLGFMSPLWDNEDKAGDRCLPCRPEA